ncbi:MAG: RNA-protein complex protein Nop10, partial [Candidatus Thermoplasmatota archaeon]|nr:RNA-protein complex protein Nop10 [Candidatus Thermoplasmatota archaeon]
MRRCPSCGRYSFQDRCPECASATRTPHPVRFSPQDRYGKYRRLLLA